jgi:hypothetical protein
MYHAFFDISRRLFVLGPADATRWRAPVYIGCRLKSGQNLPRGIDKDEATTSLVLLNYS